MAVPVIAPLPTPPSRDNPSNFAALADAFLAALVAFGPQANAVAAFINAAMQAAAASAASAINAPGTSATSATQLTVGAGAKTLAIQTGKAFVVGQFVTVAETSAPGNWMAGQIIAHDPSAGSLMVQVLATSGAGTISDWTVGLSSPMQFLPAAAADVWAGTSNTLPVTPAALLAASAPVALADAATITPDLDTGSVFTVTLGGNRTLANPVNLAPGQSGMIVASQDGTGGRKLAFGSAWKFAGGTPLLSTGANAVDVISFYVLSPTVLLCTLARAFS